jgi:predicted phosphodiesterase
LATDFRSKDFDDSAWSTGTSPFGYPATVSVPAAFGPVSGGTTLAVNGGTPRNVYYFRKTFTVNEIAAIKSLTVSTAVDDGYVLYLNGHEIKRVNMPSANNYGAITATTDPSAAITIAGSAAGSAVWDATAFRPYLVVGTNVLAAHVHNKNSDGDIYFGLSLSAGFDESLVKTGPDAKLPKQVNVHLGENAASEATVAYTTTNADTAKIVVAKKGFSDSRTYYGEGSLGTDSKYFYKIPLYGLEPDTAYSYAVGNETTFTGEFKTGPAKGSKKTIKFAYLADTQVSNATNAKGLGATLAEVANMNPDFVYLAGDITDTNDREAQWQWLFENDGQFGRGGETMFRNYAIAAIQGNHDNADLYHHIRTPAQAGKIVYTFDYGPITFIMLNLETARSDATARAYQEAFLNEKVPEAKGRGQWVAVGFHKSLYTGASHITDSDVIAARKFWCPKFADMDVDFVLQGHDHVYSRGFVNADGSRHFEDIKGPNTTVADPANAPLYMIGGHAGGLKWYSLKDYTVGEGDPLIANYAFLDVDSAKTGNGISGNPGNSITYGSDVAQEQVIVEFEVAQNQVVISCWMFKYDQASGAGTGATGTDAIITPKYLYDRVTITR